MKKKILKIILTIIAIIALAWLINITRNLFIIYDLATLESQYYSCTNFSYEAYSKDTHSIFSRKENVSYSNFQHLELTDHQIIKWINFNTNEHLTVFPAYKLAITSDDNSLVTHNQILHTFYDHDNFGKRLLLATTTLIYSSNINGIDCYSIVFSPDTTISFDKKTGLKMHEKNGYYVKDEGKESVITYFKNWKIDTVTDNDVKKPDITGYEIKKQ